MQVGRPCSPTRPLRGVVGCLFVSHLCTLCNLATVLSSVHAYTQRAAGMHALCRASHPSRGERASRLRDSAARCRVVARRVPTVARAELGLGLDPDNDLRCFGYARPHIFHVVHSVLHTGIAKNRPLTRAPLYPRLLVFQDRAAVLRAHLRVITRVRRPYRLAGRVYLCPACSYSRVCVRRRSCSGRVHPQAALALPGG